MAKLKELFLEKKLSENVQKKRARCACYHKESGPIEVERYS